MAVVFGGLLLLVFGASFALNAYVHRHEREILGQLEARLGRKVDVGRLSVSLWSGLNAERVTIGGSSLPGDQAPLLSAERLKVKPGVLRTLFSFGRHITISEIALVKPTIVVVRLADGTLNVDHLGNAPAKPKPGSNEPMDASTRRRIENARVGRIELTDGRIRFVDARSPANAVEVNRIDLTVKDVGIKGRPSIELRAAVMAAQANLQLAARLGRAEDLEHLPPPVESARLQLAPTELGPLLPFLSQVASGLQAGNASADLEISWTDKAKLKGSARLSQARFAGGAPFDAALDVDAEGHPQSGEADIRRLQIAAGEMAIVAHGKLISMTKEPRFEDFSVESRNLDFDRLRKLDPRIDRQMGAVAHGPIELHANASGQQLAAFVDLTNAAISAPGRFDKPRGTPWRIDVNGHGQKDLLQVESQVRIAQQTLHATADVHLGDKRFEARATTDQLPIAALAPMIPSLAGMPPIVISADAKISGRSGMPDTFAVDIDRLHVTSRKTDVVASLKAHNLDRPQIEARVESGYLDTADLTPAASPAKAEKSSAPPAALAHLNGHIAASATRGSLSGVAFEGLTADLAIKDGAVHANKLDVGAWGGRFSGDGSDFDVARGPFHLVGHVANIDSEQLLARLGAARKVMSGRLSAQLDVRGHGTSPAELEKTLVGTLDGSVDQAQLVAFNLEELLAGQLVRALPFHIPTQRTGNATNLGSLHGQLHFENGAIVLAKPLTANTADGPLQLAGKMYFDGRLELTGTMQLQPSAVSALFAGKIRPSDPLPLSLQLGGTIHSPKLGIPNLVDIGKVLVRSALGALIPGRQQAKVPSANQAVDTLKGLLHR